ncbi:hypothetical protein PTE_00767 [Photorhabdus khanii NC19]|uniref:Uncharacterized protein n=1 Tax=Photorhabdus khanii NC19 TaxID=1004151 RepID=W3VCT1_9GAMM|nr:hypothetical protein PTE_00767 [Photorhabdus khanii NC19]
MFWLTLEEITVRFDEFTLDVLKALFLWLTRNDDFDEVIFNQKID